MTYGEAKALYHRESFTVGERVFTRVEPGEYRSGAIVVYCDQQDSTSWAAKKGGVRTGYYWTPERAVEVLIGALSP